MLSLIPAQEHMDEETHAGASIIPGLPPLAPEFPKLVFVGFDKDVPFVPATHHLEAQIAALAEQIRYDREGERYLTPEHSEHSERITELRFDLKLAKLSQAPKPPVALLGSPPVAVRFEDGPAEGCEAMLHLPGTTCFTYADFQGVRYTALDANGIVHFAGWITDP